MPDRGHFSGATFDFIRELSANNNRPWFQQNRERYEVHLKEASFRFINEYRPMLHSISTEFRAEARATGGSLFRIYRDTRFSEDKTPYKTHLGIHFRHRAGKTPHFPGFYLHIDPRRCFVGVGFWRPESADARRIREAIVRAPSQWQAAVGNEDFRSHLELAGDSLMRAPKGYDADHPLIEDLKRKDFVGACSLTEEEITSPDFIDRFHRICVAGAPLNRFLCGALGLAF